MGSIKKFILFITYDDQMIEYVLPGMNDRKYMLNLYNKTGIEDMEVSSGSMGWKMVYLF